MTAARYIPAASTAIRSRHSTAVVYFYMRGARFCVVGYRSARVAKPSIAYGFATAQKRAAWVAQWFREQDEAAKRVADHKAAKAAALAAGHTLKAGDVLVSSWGYEQTNIDFYQVVALVGKRSVSVRPIAREVLDTEFMQGKCVPLAGQFTGEATTKRVDEYNGVRITSFQRATPAERVTDSTGRALGYKPHHFTSYA